MAVAGPGGGFSGPESSLAVAWLAFSVLLMATWFVHGRSWQPVATILTGLAIAVVVLSNWIEPSEFTYVPLLALALAAGLVLLGAGWLVSLIRVGRSVPIPNGEEDPGTG